ncbi:gluconeogenesis factor YvcK family protein [Clostridium algidicarnis]|uniref:gluconeogenesis factor YvcK family protein n=1 Tax=Clostridium algidicarnis TaxID=37659 RepID=UPI0016260E70|nr:gluconeogenesis factor YvcK family protein [Clostridium algidicarnis]MBB6697915.1 YvcK family protein [Clostridium algidicarnis]MBU3193138.1 YvcK family protein [Clostridium algidicarnis]MBU3205023.1 YvcK family protein [Clostridium algidicarnis]MBU3209357.1 YvcK family protein [Clostridium algidicarnis]MBU3213177.1 YvcK family protein [Clostridium algidicarnis]
MKFRDWLRPGIKVKRWVVFAIFGIILIIFGLNELSRHMLYNWYYKGFYILLNVTGIFILYISVTEGIKSIMALINSGYLKFSIDSKKLESLIYEKRLLVKGPKIVVIGGGTGLSTMLRGLKYYTSNITAIVTVADDGGGSGDLREDLGILPPGDIRNCILALADTEPLMEELLQYRFEEGRLKDQSFGNLFLAAMDGISDNFEEAVKKMSSVLAVTGKVMPVTLENMVLKCELKNGNIVKGESNIPKEAISQKSPINKIMIEPKDAKALVDSVEAIKTADAIILGPGSLYTSVIPNLLVKDIGEAIKKTSAIKIYVSNIMTQPGETDDYTVVDHVKAIIDHSYDGVIDYVIANIGEIGKELEEKYLEEKSKLVTKDEKELEKLNVKLIESDFVKTTKGLIRHDSEKLASVIVETIMDKKLFYDRKKIIEYFYLSERLKQKQNQKKK